MSEWTSETHALEAVKWAKQPYSGNPEITNWEAWIRMMRKEALKPYKRTIMRNQVTLGMNNNAYPTLSRFALMYDPETFGTVIKPRRVVALDCERGLEMLNELYREATGGKPRIYDWHNAQRRG